MSGELLTILSGFLEGFVLILSPCVLSILPILLAGSLTGSKKRSYGIIIGFIVFFALFSFFARQLVYYLSIDLNWIRYIAYAALTLLACVLLSTRLTYLFHRLVEPVAIYGNKALSLMPNRNGFFPGLILGGLIAIIWTPCAGPILAAVIVQIAIQKTTLLSFLTLLAFASGVAIPMLIITLYGFKIKTSFPWFKQHALAVRRTLGMIIVLNVVYMIALEQGFIYSSVADKAPVRTANYLQQGLWRPYQSPQIEGISTWLNSPPLQMNELQGKVVLIDFWAYSCINCIRTIPYLNSWYKNYHDKGLVIIGIHSPEFDFEQQQSNVANAIKRLKIAYPVALDNAFKTWRNFANHYWPAHYLIDKQGVVVYEHFGEGDYDITENNIRFLLGINELNTAFPPAALPNSNITPETYLGYARAQTSFSPDLKQDQINNYHMPMNLTNHSWGLNGLWWAYAEKVSSAQEGATLAIHFNARTVFVVMGSKEQQSVTVRLNGRAVTVGRGKDLQQSILSVNNYALYEVLDLPQKENGLLELKASKPELDVYTFTFGN